MHITTDDQCELNYQQTGHGPAIVFLHGFGGYQQIWGRQVDFFVRHGYQVITYDQRNHGATAFDPHLAHLSRLTRDLKNLLDQLALNRPVLIGHSMGASVIYDFLRRFPAVPLQGIVAVDQSPKLINTATWPYGFMTATRANYQQLLLHPNCSETSVKIDRRVFDQLATAKRQFPFDRAANRPLIADLGRQDFRSVLQSTTTPTLIITGAASPFYRPAFTQVARANPAVQTVTIAHSGHVVMAEQPMAFNQAVADFLVKLDN